jgi:phenylacetaldehyde dehydrogenase
MTGSERSKLMWKLAELIEANRDELAELESLNNGKPIVNIRNGDIPSSCEVLRYTAGWATKLNGETLSLAQPGNFHAYTLREPIGVVGPDHSLELAADDGGWKLAPALATGCTVVLKPAEQTPLTALRLARLIQEAGIPDGVVNVVNGFGETAGAALAAHPGVDKIAFTGSAKSAV